MRPRQDQWLRRWALVFDAVLCLVVAPAEAQLEGIDAWASAIVSGIERSEQGQRVPHPEPAPRPASRFRADSSLHALSVHAGDGVTTERADEALRALENVEDLLRVTHWPSPMPDGGRGGTLGFDLYLVPEPSRLADASVDGAITWSVLDAESAYGVVDASLSGQELEACVTSAYVQALLLGQDPAESRTWRRATAEWLTELVTGREGCGDAMDEQQAEPWRSWITGATDDGAGGALFLHLLSARHDLEAGHFLRELWQAARQRTRVRPELGYSGRPDLWQAIGRASELAGEKVDQAIEDLAVARWFTGDAVRARGAPMEFLNGLDLSEPVPLLREFEFSKLPGQIGPVDPPLEHYGSAYALVHVSAAPPGKQLRIWLRGEAGIRWSLVAVRIGRDGRELARVKAPQRLRTPRSYLVVELMDDTEAVLIAVTNLASHLPDSDLEDRAGRSFELTVASELASAAADEP